MKFIHTADLHIGKVINEISMIENQKKFLEDLIDILKREEAECLVIAGDVYDRSVPPAEAIEVFDEYLKKIIFELKIPVLAIAGNHDGGERLSFGNKFMKESGYHIEGIIKKNIEKVTIKDVDFYLVPYFDPAVGREVFKDESIKSHEEAMKKAIEIINKDRDMERCAVLLAHGYVTNVNFDKGKSRREILKEIDREDCDSERPLSIGGTEFISGKIFEGFDYVALGHLHEAKRVSADSERIRYSGSPLKYSISEKNHKNSVTVVELDGYDIDVKKIDIVPKRNIRVLKGTLKELMDKEFLKTQKVDDYIHFILTDDGELYEPMRKLKSVYDNPLSLERSYNRTLENRETNLNKNDLKKDKIELFEDFYENVTSDRLSEDRIAIMKNIIESIEKEK